MNSDEKDDRFSHLTSDPRFKRIPKSRRKVKIDTRFKSMFEDDRFKYNYTVDKRGRAVKNSTKEDLKRFYELSSDEETSENEINDENDEPGRFVRAPEYNSEEEAISETLKKKLTDLNVDYTRGDAKLQSDSSSDEESSDSEVSETENVEHNWGELDKDAETTNDATRRLAICNMDWDRIRAIDLMVLLNSFLPSGGLIHSVSIYPSEFGLNRMQEEEKHGPLELVNHEPINEVNYEGEEDEMGSNYHVEKLRQYQLNRLKYYYAIVECDTAQTADVLYKECDGLEYESSATKLDLRFVPDDTEFDHKPKETCSKMPDINKYQPRYFTTTALQQAKVELTWDETNHERTAIAQKLASGKIDDITDDVLQDYLASSSGEENESDVPENDIEENEEDLKRPKSDSEIIDKYKQLLAECDKNEENKNSKDVEMEISWGVNLQKKTDAVMKDKKNQKDPLTPFEKYLEKRKEKRKEKKSERLKKLKENNSNDDASDISDDGLIDKSKNKRSNKFKTNDEDEDDAKDTNTAELELLLMEKNGEKVSSDLEKGSSKSKKKTKKHKDSKQANDDFKLNVNDNRFAALFVNHHFNIDPTDPHFKKTDATQSLINEKLKRRSDTKDSIINGKKRKK